MTAVDPTASNAAPVNSTCWPPTSERDAHLGAYVADDETEIQPAPHKHECACKRNWGGPCGPCTCEMTPEQMKAEADDIAARQKAEAASTKGWIDADTGEIHFSEQEMILLVDNIVTKRERARYALENGQPDPAPSGLTAALEIRLRLAEAILAADGIPVVDTPADFVERIAHVVAGVAAVVSDGHLPPDETPHLRDWATTCPDPALHEDSRHMEDEIFDLKGALRAVAAERDRLDELREQASQGWRATLVKLDAARAQVAELKTELLETHADLEASRAREQIAQHERHQLIVERDTLAAQNLDAPAQVILLERQRDAVLALLDHLDGLDSNVGHGEIRAIYAEHGEEGSSDG